MSVDKSKDVPLIRAGDLVHFEQDSYCGIVYRVLEINEVPFEPYRGKQRYESFIEFEARVEKERRESIASWGQRYECIYVPIFTIFKQEFSKVRKRTSGHGATTFGMRKLDKARLESQLGALQRLIDTEFPPSDVSDSIEQARKYGPIYCEHANEMPKHCPCPTRCWCRVEGPCQHRL